MNFTLAVYAQERRGDGKTLAKNLIRVCSSLVLIQAEINSELFFFFVLLFTREICIYYRDGMEALLKHISV